MERQGLSLSQLVGKNLKRFIKESPYRTQAKFAEAFNTDERTVRRWCNEGVDKLSLVQQLADFLGIDALALLS